MKKILALVIICFCFILTGCGNSGAGLVQNSDGTVVEFYYVPFPQEELTKNFVSQQKIYSILQDIKIEMDSEIFEKLINDFQKQVEKDNRYTLEEKKNMVKGVTYSSNLPNAGNFFIDDITSIRYQINFPNAEAYTLFKTANKEISEEKTVQVINNFLTKTQVVKKDPLINTMFENTLTVGQFFLGKTNEIMQKHLGAGWDALKNDLNFEENAAKFSYTYVVPTKRVHSNANSITKDQDGYYYHTWEINLKDVNKDGKLNVQIEYWTTTANKWVWYAGALIGAGIVCLAVYLVAKRKEKREIKDFTSEN